MTDFTNQGWRQVLEENRRLRAEAFDRAAKLRNLDLILAGGLLTLAAFGLCLFIWWQL